ncbi:exodeoxyribonuclease VII large subunit [Dyadobacter jiangsuensis]|uniref:Exonuclease VII large subunit n=1 Tax=Dyadobacter jiangsuensis TaxID=1591085 RepID=A0A2P8FPH4_9BACT|nr:exodeoxyribonuclease VII large subunit [Dyadobacter jiangsuensis]PSL23624.1 exonuclease VII large subunit [Dyadobacter jiangsuensis]
MHSHNTIKDSFVFTPTELLTQFRNSLHSTMDGQLLAVSGFYNSTGREQYGDYFYDQLSCSADVTGSLAVKVSALIRDGLENDSYYTFKGFIEKGRVNRQGINLSFQVTEVAGVDKAISRFSNEDFNLIGNRVKRGFADIRTILAGQIEKGLRPPILVLTGNESIADQDFKHALEDTYSCFDFFWIRAKLGTPGTIIEAIQKVRLDNPPLLVFMRGGGSGLEVFNSITLCKAVFDLGIPFVTAIGHHSDEPLLQKFADRGFATPTAFGHFLKDLAKHVAKQTKTISYLSSELEKARNEQKKERRLLYCIIGVILLLLLLVLLR